MSEIDLVIMRKATLELRMGSTTVSYIKPSFRGARSAQIDEVNFALGGRTRNP
jgi:hypothetical protein